MCVSVVPMTKSKKSKSQKKTKIPPRQGAAIIRNAMARYLDGPAQAYKRLLLDPCGAPMVHPIWGSVEGSFLIKCESFGNVGVSATEGNGAAFFSPGTISTTAKSGYVGMYSTTSAGAVNLVAGTGGTVLDWTNNAINPGYTFLAANASVYRPVAVCVELVYLGSESTRSGMVAGGVISGGAWYNQTAVSVDNVMALVPSAERTPVNKVEYIWYPSTPDSVWQDPTETVAVQQVDRRNTLAFAWSGIPVNTGFRVKTTAVYEYKPKLGLNVTTPQITAGSRNSMADVLSDITRTVMGNPWVRSAAQQTFVQAVQYQMNRTRQPRIEL